MNFLKQVAKMKWMEPIHLYAPALEKIFFAISAFLMAWQLFWYGLMAKALPITINIGYKFPLPYVPGPAWEFKAWGVWMGIFISGAAIFYKAASKNDDPNTQLLFKLFFWASYGCLLVTAFSKF